MTEIKMIEKKQRGKESDKKYFGKFIVMILISLFIGGFFGFFSMGFRDWILANVHIEEEVEALRNVMGLIVLGIDAAGILFLSIVALYNYARAKKMSGTWDGEDEAVIDAIDRKLDIALLWNSLLMVFTLLFFALTIHASGILEQSEQIAKKVVYLNMWPILAFFGGCVVLLVGIALNIIISKVTVDLRKHLNPEKQGSVFDMKFDRKWEASSDEAERQIMYKAAYTAFRAANMACLILWTIAVVIQMFVHTGVFPVVCICAIWLVLNVTYSRMVMKLQKYK